HPPAREVSEAEPDSIGRDRSCGPTVGATPKFASCWIFATRVVAGVLINTLLPRQQDTGQRTSGQQINQLEGLALARAWGFESPFRTTRYGIRFLARGYNLCDVGRFAPCGLACKVRRSDPLPDPALRRADCRS